MSNCRTVVEVSCNQYTVLEACAQGPQGIQGIPGPTGVGLQEVFYQSTDPVVTYPAINFKAGFFPAHPDIPTLLVYKP